MLTAFFTIIRKFEDHEAIITASVLVDWLPS